MQLGPYTLGPNDTHECGIYQGDALELIRAVPDASVRAIICDPDYRKHAHYAMLVGEGARVLMPGGSALAQTGHIYAWENEAAMVEANLELVHRPRLNEVFTGGFKTLWMHRALRADTPYIWFEKEPMNGRGWPRTAFFGGRDKSRHKWADGVRAFMYLIETFTQPGDVVLDPYTGSGTVPAACIMLGRRYLAFELDADTCAMARDRVRTTQPPLPGLVSEQLEMAI